jgi:hypothetical protein
MDTFVTRLSWASIVTQSVPPSERSEVRSIYHFMQNMQTGGALELSKLHTERSEDCETIYLKADETSSGWSIRTLSR